MSNKELEQKPDLSAEEIKFSALLAKGFSGVKAYRASFPAEKNYAYSTIRRKASELITNSDIQSEVATIKARQARLARLSEERIEEILVDDEIGYKGSKVADVAMFMYDHANGKAVNKVQHSGVFVHAAYDLTGSQEEVPPEILQQLEDDEETET